MRFIFWALWGVVQIVLLSIALRVSRWRLIVFLQSITPLLGIFSIVVGVGAAITGDWLLAILGGVQVFWVAMLALGLQRWHQDRHLPRLPVPQTQLRVAHSNLLHSNVTPAQAMADVFATDADVIAFSEITAHLHMHAEQHLLALNWPHRIHDLRDGPRGIALWSKFPLTESSIEKMHDCNAAVATVRISRDIQFRVLAIHPMAPVSRQKTRDWEPSLRSIGDALSGSNVPAIAIGDYNATHWHPPMRELYRRGLHSAHLRLGRIFSSTFPVGRRLRPFLNLDHALVTESVMVHEITHVRVSGSDHRGIVIDVSAYTARTSSPHTSLQSHTDSSEVTTDIP